MKVIGLAGASIQLKMKKITNPRQIIYSAFCTVLGGIMDGIMAFEKEAEREQEKEDNELVRTLTQHPQISRFEVESLRPPLLSGRDEEEVGVTSAQESFQSHNPAAADVDLGLIKQGKTGFDPRRFASRSRSSAVPVLCR